MNKLFLGAVKEVSYTNLQNKAAVNSSVQPLTAQQGWLESSDFFIFSLCFEPFYQVSNNSKINKI